MLKNTVQKYGSVAKFFHWLIFLMMASSLYMGFVMVGMSMSPDKFKLYGRHKSFGATILILAVLRLLWKMANVAPVLPSHMRPIEKFLAHAGHAMLYVLMIGMPMTGWLMSSASGFPVSVFGLFTLPDLIAPDKDVKDLLVMIHGWIAWVILAVVGLHILAALLHHFYYKDNVLRRMIPWGKIKENPDA